MPHLALAAVDGVSHGLEIYGLGQCVPDSRNPGRTRRVAIYSWNLQRRGRVRNPVPRTRELSRVTRAAIPALAAIDRLARG
jgi:hypothetical protein